MSLRSHFSLASIKTKGLTLAIEHSPCCLLSFAAGFIGVAALHHNPLLELGFAIGGALIGDHVAHKYIKKDCVHNHTNWGKVKRYSLSVCFGLASWGAHQLLLHDHMHDTHAEPVPYVEQHDCDHEDFASRTSLAPKELQEAMQKAHNEHHKEYCGHLGAVR